MAAIATLHTPWDCKWSRFARRPTGQETRGGMWECVHSGERRAVAEGDCESCPHWEFQSPFEGLIDRTRTYEQADAIRVRRRLEQGIRLSLLVTAFIFAACGFVVLTSPLAVPVTVSLWLGAAASALLGIWGNFQSHADGSYRGFLGLLPPRT